MKPLPAVRLAGLTGRNPALLNYRVRLAELEDLARCLEIDTSYITTYVWQMQESFDDPQDSEPEEVALARARNKIVGKALSVTPPAFHMDLKPSRLPHPLAVAPQLSDQQLLAEWKRTDYMLVAELIEPEQPAPPPDDSFASDPEAEIDWPLPPSPQPDLLGYIGLGVDTPRHVAWITSGAVQLNFRRQGIGSQLLSEARAWADRYRLRSVMAEVQTRNYPAIKFFQKNDFFFCGYNNAFYSTREIALFFGRRLEKFN